MTPTLKAPPRAKSILDAAFRYRPSHATDVRWTFERVHRGLAHRGWRGRGSAARRRGPHPWNAVVESAVHRTRRVALIAAATKKKKKKGGGKGYWRPYRRHGRDHLLRARPLTPRGSKPRGRRHRPLWRLRRLVTKGLSMNPPIVNMRLPCLVSAGELPAVVPGHAPVRMDGECLLPAGGEPVQRSLCCCVPDVDALRRLAHRADRGRDMTTGPLRIRITEPHAARHR